MRPAARLDLAGSNICACSIDELPDVRQAIAFEGNNETAIVPFSKRSRCATGLPPTA